MGVGVVEELPPPQVVSPGDRNAETIVSSTIEPWVRRNDENILPSIESINVSPVQIGVWKRAITRSGYGEAAGTRKMAVPAIAERIRTLSG
jgi:hypothetical protein